MKVPTNYMAAKAMTGFTAALIMTIWRAVPAIGIGRSLAAPPSHTTGRTGHVSGGSMN